MHENFVPKTQLKFNVTPLVSYRGEESSAKKGNQTRVEHSGLTGHGVAITEWDGDRLCFSDIEVWVAEYLCLRKVDRKDTKKVWQEEQNIKKRT